MEQAAFIAAGFTAHDQTIAKWNGLIAKAIRQAQATTGLLLADIVEGSNEHAAFENRAEYWLIAGGLLSLSAYDFQVPAAALNQVFEHWKEVLLQLEKDWPKLQALINTGRGGFVSISPGFSYNGVGRPLT